MPFRVLIAAVLLIALLLVLLVLLLATDTALSVWNRLREAPLWLQVGYGLLVAVISMGSMLLLWRVLRPGKKKQEQSTHEEQLVVEESQLEQEILDAANSGIDIQDSLRELEDKRNRAPGWENLRRGLRRSQRRKKQPGFGNPARC